MSTQFYRVGGFATDTPSDVINLWAKVFTSGNVSTFRKAGTTSGYQTTTGKQFYITQITITVGDDSSSNITCSLGYADNDVGIDSSTARTNPVALMGDPEQTTQSTVGGIAFDGTPALASFEGARFSYSTIWKGAPSQKYLYMKSINQVGTGTCVLISGFEI